MLFRGPGRNSTSELFRRIVNVFFDSMSNPTVTIHDNDSQPADSIVYMYLRSGLVQQLNNYVFYAITELVQNYKYFLLNTSNTPPPSGDAIRFINIFLTRLYFDIKACSYPQPIYCVNAVESDVERRVYKVLKHKKNNAARDYYNHSQLSRFDIVQKPIATLCGDVAAMIERWMRLYVADHVRQIQAFSIIITNEHRFDIQTTKQYESGPWDCQFEEVPYMYTILKNPKDPQNNTNENNDNDDQDDDDDDNYEYVENLDIDKQDQLLKCVESRGRRPNYFLHYKYNPSMDDRFVVFPTKIADCMSLNFYPSGNSDDSSDNTTYSQQTSSLNKSTTTIMDDNRVEFANIQNITFPSSYTEIKPARRYIFSILVLPYSFHKVNKYMPMPESVTTSPVIERSNGNYRKYSYDSVPFYNLTTNSVSVRSHIEYNKDPSQNLPILYVYIVKYDSIHSNYPYITCVMYQFQNDDLRSLDSDYIAMEPDVLAHSYIKEAYTKSKYCHTQDVSTHMNQLSREGGAVAKSILDSRLRYLKIIRKAYMTKAKSNKLKQIAATITSDTYRVSRLCTEGIRMFNVPCLNLLGHVADYIIYTEQLYITELPELVYKLAANVKAFGPSIHYFVELSSTRSETHPYSKMLTSFKDTIRAKNKNPKLIQSFYVNLSWPYDYIGYPVDDNNKAARMTPKVFPQQAEELHIPSNDTYTDPLRTGSQILDNTFSQSLSMPYDPNTSTDMNVDDSDNNNDQSSSSASSSNSRSNYFADSPSDSSSASSSSSSSSTFSNSSSSASSSSNPAITTPRQKYFAD
jgi:hypothetical protein